MNAKLLLIATLLLSPASASAHDTTGPNGGPMIEAGSYHLELVVKANTVELFVSDKNEKPVAVTGFKGIAILNVDGKAQRIPLEPTGSTRLSGTATVALPAQPKGVVQLTAPDGKAAQAKFQ